MEFRSDPADNTVIHAKVEEIAAHFGGRLLSGTPHLRKVTLQAPEVRVSERDGPPGSRPSEDRPPEFYLGEIAIGEGRFIYEKLERGKRGRIQVTDIEGEITDVAGGPGSASAWTKGKATGSLEGSGDFTLEIEARPWRVSADPRVRLEIRKFDLSQVNPYFLPIDGVRLSGSVDRGRAEVTVEESRLESSARLQYRGLDLDFRPGSEHGILDALVQDIGADLALADERSSPSPVVKLRRKGRESLISFILRGMKEAALRVATG